MKKRYSFLMIFSGATLLFSSCLKDLDTIPPDTDVVTSEKVYQNPDNYINVLAKCYLGLAVGGQGGDGGGDANTDISGIDGGFSQYLRQYWYHQEFTTDEAIVSWNDQTIKDLHYQTWSTTDVFVTAMYYRIMFQVNMANEFIRNSTPAKLDDRGIGSQYRKDIAYYHAEARFLRALSYWHGLDMFRNIPFITENDPIGAYFPKQTTPENLFRYIESELIAITDGVGDDDLKDARTNAYGRADKAAAQMLLAKLYLNARVYLNLANDAAANEYYDKCVSEISKVISAGYTLEPKFKNLFVTDNDNSNEIIFPIAFDGLKTQTWGGTTILVHAAIGGKMIPDSLDGKKLTAEEKTAYTISHYGVGSGWGGFRTTKELVGKYGDIATTNDSRAVFFTDGQNLEINNVGLFNDGYAVPKFSNLSSTGVPGQNVDFTDTDFPMFRLADAYLIYAEAQIRRDGSANATSLGYINEIRTRAYGDNSGSITIDQLTLDFILDERACELLWEGHRRTDLIRFGKFTGDKYLWAWKGLVKDGIATPAYRNIFPIPANDLNANPNLKQNDGY